MITLLATIIGFISSILPEILKILKDLNDKKHELHILDRQIENNKLNHSKTFTELTISKEMAEQYSLYSTYKSGISWVDALNSSVRPVLAYSFFAMYGGVKYIQYKAIKNTAILAEYLDVLWSIEDQTIFAGIISFYFGQRTFSKFWKQKNIM
ncbi:MULTISPECIES: hypothetical protein [unclassified Rickettsia]|uniref:hypothetical protein n=1 Tax=unclassified Rickettsia TaxID=114295 RepID=UPI00209E55EF|nr:hypothetical protein [Rickettsia endosymbiont of Ceutorhynchus assimilis]